MRHVYGVKMVWSERGIRKAENCLLTCAMCAAGAAIALAAWAAWYCWDSAIWRIMGE